MKEAHTIKKKKQHENQTKTDKKGNKRTEMRRKRKPKLAKNDLTKQKYGKEK